MKEELKVHLHRQLKLLETSSRAFDNGDIYEAINIAIRLRVLLHDTFKSTSLLTHLEQKNKLYFLSTLETIEEEKNRFIKEHGVLVQQNDPPAMIIDGERKPPFSSWSIKKHLPFDLWWNEKILKINDKEYSRKDIVFITANKDGGAHIELKINEKTKLLKKGTGRVKYRIGNEEKEKELIDTHFIFLRQLAYEVLSIEELFTCNDLEFNEPICETITYNGLLREAEKLINEEQYVDAKIVLEKAIYYDSYRKEAYNNLGSVYEELEKYDEAIKNYEKSIKLDSSYLDPYHNLSNIYYKNKQYDLVIEICEKMLEINPDDMQAKVKYNHIIQIVQNQDK
ncbi:MAG: tetratricopeptide repeat protein [Gammaproteobacteria bacterium]|nr:tetratricopeptide repeat protein [Gammaproteobacteria bacterium]